ncbi:uncharacterized protein LOC132202611 [Neocloeon triangulifer]|uniref:uncharacterized protein LOC132202611 n=1 Tax=Neocloeon triangulifer TaxID=2078957 RepID=UPI00286EDC3C|nr:uncharacterized protein LOC132202611 [Neocloeon triangulifer]
MHTIVLTSFAAIVFLTSLSVSFPKVPHVPMKPTAHTRRGKTTAFRRISIIKCCGKKSCYVSSKTKVPLFNSTVVKSNRKTTGTIHDYVESKSTIIMDYNSVESGPEKMTETFSTPVKTITEDAKRFTMIDSSSSSVSVSDAETSSVGLGITETPSTTLVESLLSSANIVRAASESTSSKITDITIPTERIITVPIANLMPASVVSIFTSSKISITTGSPAVTTETTVSTKPDTTTAMQTTTTMSLAEKTYAGAIKECCSIGMSLLSFDLTIKYEALINAIKTLGADGDYFWTSGIKTASDGKFGFLAVQKPFGGNARWEPGQPDNAGGIENAVAVYVNASYARLFDFEERKIMRFICEGSDATTNNTAGTTASNECAFTYNVSQIEIDQLLNNTHNLDIRMKCFLRCMGEQAGLMVNGVYIDSQVLAILENMAQGNISELSQNVAVATECGNTPDGMDECEKAAEIIRCSYDKSPDVVRAVITAVDQSLPTPPKNDFVSLQGQCPSNVSCVLDPIKQKIIGDCTGTCNTTLGEVDQLCGKKWYRTYASYNNTQNLTCACAEVGMKLGSLEIPSILKCMQVSNAFGGIHGVAGLFDIAGDGNWRWCPSKTPFTAEGYTSVTFDPTNRAGVIECHALTDPDQGKNISTDAFQLLTDDDRFACLIGGFLQNSPSGLVLNFDICMGPVIH